MTTNLATKLPTVTNASQLFLAGNYDYAEVQYLLLTNRGVLPIYGPVLLDSRYGEQRPTLERPTALWRDALRGEHGWGVMHAGAVVGVQTVPEGDAGDDIGVSRTGSYYSCFVSGQHVLLSEILLDAKVLHWALVTPNLEQYAGLADALGVDIKAWAESKLGMANAFKAP